MLTEVVDPDEPYTDGSRDGSRWGSQPPRGEDHLESQAAAALDLQLDLRSAEATDAVDGLAQGHSQHRHAVDRATTSPATSPTASLGLPGKPPRR